MALLAATGLEEEVLPRVFLAIAVVIVVARLAGAAARRLRQPPVVGEIIGGILLGPTLLGAFPGQLDEVLFPADIRPHLTVIANLGLIIFMFIVGLELDMTLIRGKERIAGVISLSSITLPMVLGIGLATILHSRYAGPGSGSTGQIELLPFALFIGSAMSVTAFPVLARILVDRGMYRTTLGSLTLACAAVDDVLAWTLLAVVLAVIRTGTFLAWDFPRTVALSLLFGALMWYVVRPALTRLVPAYEQRGRLTPNLASVVLIGFLASAFITAEIGIHHILGAFAFGAVMPREGAHALTLELLERLEQISVLLLLPVFFVTTGLAVDIGALGGPALLTLAMVLTVACAGKFLGAATAARLQGIGLRRSAAIGTLMNTRGLTELIVLTVGREYGVLDDTLFTIMVVMTVVTTVITEPGLRLFYPDALLARDIAEAERAARGDRDVFEVMVVVDDPSATGPAASLAASIARFEDAGQVVLSRLVPSGPAPELGAGLSAQLLELTGAMEAMHALEQQVAATGVGCRVLTRFGGAGIGSELEAHVASTTPALVLTLDPDVDPTRLARASEVMVGRIVATDHGGPPAGRGVLVLVDDGATAGRLIEIALRLAASDPDPVLTVVGEGRVGRRLGRLEDLRRPRVVVAAASDVGGGAWRTAVTGPGAAPGAGLVTETMVELAVPPAASLDLDDVMDRWLRREEPARPGTAPGPRTADTDEHKPVDTTGDRTGQA